MAVKKYKEGSPAKTHKDGTAAAVLGDPVKKLIKNVRNEANSTAQYFWHVDGVDPEAGAHITQISQKKWEKNPSGGNILIQSQTIKFRMAMTLLNELASDGMKVYEPEDDENPVAQFLGTGVILGKEAEQHISIANGIFSFLSGLVEVFSMTLSGTKAELKRTLTNGYADVTMDDAGVGISMHTGTSSLYREATHVDITDNTTALNLAGATFKGENDTKNAHFMAAAVEDEAWVEISGDNFNVSRSGQMTVNGNAPFTTFTATGTVTLSAGSGDNVTLTGTVPSGYTPIAVQAVESAHNRTVLIGKFSLTSSGASVTLRNVGGDNYTNMTVSATILCTALQ